MTTISKRLYKVGLYPYTQWQNNAPLCKDSYEVFYVLAKDHNEAVTLAYSTLKDVKLKKGFVKVEGYDVGAVELLSYSVLNID